MGTRRSGPKLTWRGGLALRARFQAAVIDDPMYGPIAFAVVAALIGLLASAAQTQLRHRRIERVKQQYGSDFLPSGPDDPDLSAFRRQMEYVNATSYGGTFPLDRTEVGWAFHPSREDAYAFAMDYGTAAGIYLVPTEFRRNAPYNLDVARHEMAHIAVGVAHWHDGAFLRELERLRAVSIVESFDQVRAESGP